ncbi:uncharacterized protein E0L32_010232 [Thyridium curvatum]|uniref:Major facilitator superfamily (MFS) profile domain-containing protein n=1 Tax=Thyridium curvatum TaxID=1093900 RepID=A0A507AGP7_9PEZI|nr:uncharacterized protein E0L32_010232 [Thyridium curvatum]TPX08032.1 hypothetical protein E0L32_010232 [Thyridium curvatum]
MALSKQEGSGFNSYVDPPDSESSSPEREWSFQDELKARRKIDFSVLPLLYLGLLFFQLDRMNLASALTGGFAADIHVSQDTINLGNQLMFLGIVILEIPSNMLLQKIGPRKYISGQVITFGFVASMQVFLRDREGFLASRIILGLAEAGYIPGACYTLSTWYTKRELSKRVAIFFFGMFSGNAISPVLASGILKLDGAQGMRGWQWLFLIEGVATVVVGIALLLLLPGSPDQPDPLLSPGLVRFKGPERAILQKRLELDDSERRHGSQGMHIPLSLVWKTVSHWRRWFHFLSSFCVFSTWSPLTTYTPTIIMYVKTASMWVMLSISGLMVGTQYYRGNDVPFYSNGLRIQIIMVAVGMAFAILQTIIYRVHNWRVAQGKHYSEKAPRIYVP